MSTKIKNVKRKPKKWWCEAEIPSTIYVEWLLFWAQTIDIERGFAKDCGR